MRPAANPDKKMVLRGLRYGDKVKLTDGSIAEFVKLKQKNFDGLINGQPYNIPVNMFVEVVEKAEAVTESKEYMTLKKGEPFYINYRGAAQLFTFEGMENFKIVGTCPVTKKRTTIAPSLYFGKVADLS
jgi:hypothetical protein